MLRTCINCMHLCIRICTEHNREYILTSANTFSPSSQQMFASKGNMLSCMILLIIELYARVQLLARIIAQSVDAPEQDYMLSCIILLAI